MKNLINALKNNPSAFPSVGKLIKTQTALFDLKAHLVLLSKKKNAKLYQLYLTKEVIPAVKAVQELLEGDDRNIRLNDAIFALGVGNLKKTITILNELTA
jgi:hypothetical protein